VVEDTAARKGFLKKRALGKFYSKEARTKAEVRSRNGVPIGKERQRSAKEVSFPTKKS